MALLAAPWWALGCAEADVAHQHDAAIEVDDARAERDPVSIEPASSVDAGAYLFPCLGGATPAPSDSFESIYLEVLCKHGCVDSYCHGSRGAWAGLDMASTLEGAYAALVGQPAGSTVPVDARPTCRGSALKRVEPFAPERSILYLKLSGEPPCGTRMPPGDSGRSALDAAELEHVRRWIEAGAPLSAP